MDDIQTPPTLRPEPPTADEGVAWEVAQRLFGPEEASRLFGTAVAPRPASIGRFTVLREIGAGAMGSVDLAHDPKLDRKVALKSLRHLDDYSRVRFLQEAQAMARVKHPNVVEVHEVIELDGAIHIVMEYVEGTTLADWQRDKHWRQVLEAYVQAGRGLAAAHEAGFLHRDFKPSNVLISSKEGRVCVADFGLAVVDPAIHVGVPEVRNWLAGTREYLAPEIYAQGPASILSDQFGYCVSLWEAVCGGRPFSPEQIAKSTSNGSLPLPKRFEGPGWLREVVARGLELDPRLRWPAMVELVDTLEQTPSRRRRRATVLGLSILPAIALALSLARDSDPPCPTPDTPPEFWDIERRAALAKLRDGDNPGSSILVATVERELAAHAARHAQERADLCVAWQARETTDIAFARSNVCLDHVADRTAILFDSLLNSDGSGLTHADGLLAELPDAASCRTAGAMDVAETRWWLLPTVDRLAIDRGWMASAAGDQALAVETAERVLEGTPSVANEIGAMALRSSALQRTESPATRDSIRALIRRATWAQADESLFDGLIRLALFDSTVLENDSSARIALDLAGVVAERLGDPAFLTARLYAAEAEHALLLGELDVAQKHLSNAIARHRETGSPRPKIADVEMRLAYVHALRGETELAVNIYSRLLAEQIDRLGPDHVNVGTIELNLGITLADAGDWQTAKGHLQRAQTIFRASSQMRALASTLTKLADTETELGEHASALWHAEVAWSIQLRELPPDHSEYGHPLRTLAWASVQSGNWEVALRHHEALLALELGEAERAAVHETIGWLLCRLGRFDAARPHAELATTGPEPAVRARAEAVLIEVKLAHGSPQVASTMLVRVIESIDFYDIEDSALEAELAWLQVQIDLALGGPMDTLRDHMDSAWQQSEYLSTDQKSLLRSQISNSSGNRK